MTHTDTTDSTDEKLAERLRFLARVHQIPELVEAADAISRLSARSVPLLDLLEQAAIATDKGKTTFVLNHKRYAVCDVIHRARACLSSRSVPQGGWKCKARPTADPPEDCNWPFCGCHPATNEVMDALEESGFTLVQKSVPQDEQTVERCAKIAEGQAVDASAPLTERLSSCCIGCRTVIASAIRACLSAASTSQNERIAKQYRRVYEAAKEVVAWASYDNHDRASIGPGKFDPLKAAISAIEDAGK